MRVIAGSARRLQLRTIEGKETRPTTDRIKETLFNIINFDLGGAYFLDLFSGSGGIGIEALSRGARRAVFVEQNRKAADVIRYNLEHTKLADKGEILVRDAMSSISILEGRGESFDFIYMDPPYGNGLEVQTLKRLAGSSLLKKDCLLIAESDLHTDYSELENSGLIPVREKRYKTNMHTFFKMG